MLNLRLTRRFWKIFFTRWLRKIYVTTILPSYFSCRRNLEPLIQTRLKGYYNNAIDVRIYLNWCGSKIRKVSRYRPTVSNESIPETEQKFFFTKVAPVQSLTDILLLGFWLTLLPWMFILSYTTIYFFEENFLFECL